MPADRTSDPSSAPAPGRARNVDAQGLPPGYTFRPEWEVTPRGVKAMLDAKEDFLFLDCRTPGEHQAAAIHGAVLIPLHALVDRMPELESQKAKKIVVHCHHGGRSLQATAFLRQQGFTNVKSMAGGIDLWSMDVDPKVPRY